MISNVADYLKDRKKFNFTECTIEGLVFNLIPLTDDMIQEFESDNTTYEGMLSVAADYGVSIGRVRVCEDEEMKAELKGMWELDQFSDCDPSLYHKVGEKVCAISGLTEYIENMKLEEETAPEENHLNGDDLPAGETELDNLAQANLDRDALNAA